MNVFYEKSVASGQMHLSEDESRHCVQVLRMKSGDRIQLFDGDGGIYNAALTEVNKKLCRFEIEERTISKPKQFRIHLAIAPTKNIDRMEWMVEKLGEMGVDEITFIKTENSERSKVRIDRLERKAISAMKQSKYPFLAQLNPIVPFKDWIPNVKTTQKCIAHVDRAHTYLGELIEANQDTAILIGPEGDFSFKEVDQAISSGFEPVSLGMTTLRTETAGLAACHLINVVNQF